MLVTLTQLQARVIGVLLEKEVTTPEQYPLSLNSITTACNQKSNREPVMELTELEVQNTLDELHAKNMIFEQSGSRATRYKHRFCNTEFSDLQLTPQQLAVICVLLLRGPQTPGELRTRAQRMAGFTHVDEVEKTLNELQDVNGEQLVVRLEREPGKRESRYAQQFYKDTNEAASHEQATASESSHPSISNSTNNPNSSTQESRIIALENAVNQLHIELAQLKQTLDDLTR
ncbi:hypothetical protein FX988_01539 [Paraglaciecola mesophila]|uniref:Uncharacterized protein n=1 Tax=Paraglaciecola mesophila TaxID=197222 RepID=A0A857JK03_9ALTE|nr:YceH family protein [Paraglaciecola mesophila]QHJ11311.1 hypothetical protein FX988_01539 [Paraglaciecola mesophila]